MVRDSFQAQKTCFKRPLCLNSSFASQPTESTVCRLHHHLRFKLFGSHLNPMWSVPSALYFGGGRAEHQLKAACLFPLSVVTEPSNGRYPSWLSEVRGLLLSRESPALESFRLRRNNPMKMPEDPTTEDEQGVTVPRPFSSPLLRSRGAGWCLLCCKPLRGRRDFSTSDTGSSEVIPVDFK